MTAPVASVTLVRTISFSIYQKSKYVYAGWIRRSFGIDPLVHANTKGVYPNAATISCFGAAGATAGSLITIVACKPFKFLIRVSLPRLLISRRASKICLSFSPAYSTTSLLTSKRPFRTHQTQRSGFGSYGGPHANELV